MQKSVDKSRLAKYIKSEKISTNDIKDKVIEAAKVLKIEDLLDRSPKELSPLFAFLVECIRVAGTKLKTTPSLAGRCCNKGISCAAD